MRKFFSLLSVMLITLAFVSTDADARRFGGGKSIGKQRDTSSQQQAAPRQPAPAAPAAAPARGNRWLGPLAGLAAGGLLASLFMGHGFDGIKPMDILLILGVAAAIFFVFRAMRRNQAAPQPMRYAGMNTGHEFVQEPAALTQSSGVPLQATPSSRPAWFEDEPFLREAKVHFIRLQAAYDSGDLADIREYVTPEIFAEISMQIQERGTAPQKTEVVTLNADMLDVITEGDKVTASVQFSGLIREEINGSAEPFKEVWHIQKSLNGTDGKWYISGLQQANLT